MSGYNIEAVEKLTTIGQVVGTVNVTTYLTERTSGLKDFIDLARDLLGRGAPTLEGSEDITTLKTKLRRQKILPKPVLITVHGALVPHFLLRSGWWERQPETHRNRITWKDDLQAWLFTGFEQWGPSWDLNVEPRDGSDGVLVAQLGAGDEVESIPVVIPAPIARGVREHLCGLQRVLSASVTGLLCHRRHRERLAVPQRSRLDRLNQWDKNFDYCLLLDPEDRRHAVSRRHDAPDIYSGYLWQCVAPKAWVKDRNALINDVYFVWEHTDFTKPDAVNYNLDSLAHKVSRLEQRHGEVALLQKSSTLVPGEPTLSTEEFYRLIMGSA